MSAIQARVQRVLLRLVASGIGTDPDSIRYSFIETFVKALAFVNHKHVVHRWGRFLTLQGARFRKVRWYKWASETFGNLEYNFHHQTAADELGFSIVDSTASIMDSWKFASSQFENTSSFHKLVVQVNAEKLIKSPGELLSFSNDEVTETRLYNKLWMAHSSYDGGLVDVFAQNYAAAVRWDPTKIFHIMDSVLMVGGYHKTAEVILSKLSAKIQLDVKAIEYDGKLKRRQKTKQILKLERVKRRLVNFQRQVRMELGQDNSDEDIVIPSPDRLTKENIDDFYWGALQAQNRQDIPRYLKLMEDYIFYNNLQSLEANSIASAHYSLAVYYETALHFEKSFIHYRQAMLTDKVRFYLPVFMWRFASALMALDRWHEASQLLVYGLSNLWPIYSNMMEIPPQKRLRGKRWPFDKPGTLVPKRGALILGCQGLGDDILRLGMLDGYAKLDKRFAMTCDPRLLTLLERSFPNMTFFAQSRRGGPFGVDAIQYWRDREGVKPGQDFARVDRKVLKSYKKFSDVMISEDIMLHFCRFKGEFTRERIGSTLKACPSRQLEARSWLDSLPNRVKVGVSWRSGVRYASRSEFYIDVMELGPLWNVKDVDFVSLQYSDTTAEEAEILAEYGVILHKMPGLDLKDDMEGVAALALECDVVLSTCTAMREIAGAVGANTISLTSIPVLPDLWRVEDDGETDKIFPSMIHVTHHKQGSKDSVIVETARRVAEL